MTTLPPQQIQLVTSTWARVAPSAPAVAALFYERLLTLDPQLKPLFKGDMVAQGGKLMEMIGAAVGLLDRPAVLTPVLRNLGRRHQGYGVVDAHYDVVGQALLQTLEAGLGEAFTTSVRSAWTAVYGALARQMKAGAAVPQATPAICVTPLQFAN